MGPAVKKSSTTNRPPETRSGAPSGQETRQTETAASGHVSAALTEMGQLYTPAMLAGILGVSVRVIRRWHRAGLLQAATEVLQLPYFDFAQVAAARRLARWMAQGATVQSIQQQLQLLRQRAAGAIGSDPAHCDWLTIVDLPISADGKRLILRAGEHYLEASGQLRFGFEEATDDVESTAAVLPFARSAGDTPAATDAAPNAAHPLPGDSGLSLEQMLDCAMSAEDVDDLTTAIDWYRSAMAAFGTSADLCFQLAELLYRGGDLAGARERYYVALELDGSLVEARANLGCVLAECGQPELAVAAFEGTLSQYADYADVHFHLARSLEDLGQPTRAVEHWQQFLELAPASPWAEEARQRLQQLSPLLDF